MHPFAGWEDFYVIVGSSAGALIGLQFVVMTLLTDLPFKESQLQAGHAFGTPTIVHFSAVLLLAGVMCAPWRGMAPASHLWGVLGLSGLVYCAVVLRRMRQQTAYRPEFEDWLFHAVLPLVAYATLFATAWVAGRYPYEALFGNAAAGMLLLFIGIHNAWDAVTYHVFVQRSKHREAQQREGKQQ
jgi:hypothetical protein